VAGGTRRRSSQSPDQGPFVAVVMGSDSDLPVMRGAIDALAEFGLSAEVRILSAHRTPMAMLEFAQTAAARGLRVIVAGAGGAAHLPGMIASATPLPVIGVPVPATQLVGVDALLSIAQMPAGVPVATVAIGGARNAGLLAVRILAAADPALLAAMERFQAALADAVRAKDAAVQAEFLNTDAE
jgi:5-(carboxyamino)imidazole ribonucleotide mutase